MRQYRTIAPARIGAGVLVALTELQAKTREHNLEIVKKQDGVGVLARGKIPLEFAPNETIGLEQLPKNMIDNMVPIAPPESQSEQFAVARHAARESGKPDPKAPSKQPDDRRGAGRMRDKS